MGAEDLNWLGNDCHCDSHYCRLCSIVVVSSAEPKPQNAPSYGGWSEGDVLAYLSRFGMVTAQDRHSSPWWSVESGALFYVEVRLQRAMPQAKADWWWFASLACGGTTHNSDTLPEAMQWAVERWRELVAESDPTPQESTNDCDCPQGRERHCSNTACPRWRNTTTRHVMTGDMGQRSEFSNGWHDVDEGK